jgi:hypothetical protein
MLEIIELLGRPHSECQLGQLSDAVFVATFHHKRLRRRRVDLAKRNRFRADAGIRRTSWPAGGLKVVNVEIVLRSDRAARLYRQQHRQKL